jgi:Family of unknown function (DUF5906)
MLAPADNISVRFLKLILPEQGYYITWVKRRGRNLNIFASSVEELWSEIEDRDRDAWETYHACANFNKNEHDRPDTPRAQRRLGRTHYNVKGARALWIDIDAGKGKPYATQDEAGAALKLFLKVTGLPIPLVVKSSDYGLHVYWPLAHTLDPETWRRYASGLQALCVKHGLHVDPTRTADISSVLRTPGTSNRKNSAAVPVKFDPAFLQIQPYALQKFASLLDAGPQGAVAKAGFTASPPWLGRARAAKTGSVSADLLGGLADYAPAYAADIVNSCGQIAALRDAPGTVSEPLWHAALGVLAHCEDGKELAHAWSAPEWHAAIDEKLERLESFGPTTCEKFQSLNSSPCAACKHRGTIRSPIKTGERQHGSGARPYDEIEELNGRYFVVKVGGKSLVGEFVTPHGEGRRMLSLMSVDAFNTWLANRKIAVRDHQGNEKLKPLAKAWLEHPRRRQYESLELNPSGPTELPNGSLNLWRGFGVEEKKGEWPLLAWHVREVLAQGDPKAADYIFRWTAWSLQHPGELAEAALVLRGGKGSGKGVFGNTLAKIFGEHALHIFHQNHLTGNFNGHLRSCLFLFADESFWAGDKKGESVLKGLVTERTLAIEQKGVDVVPWPNRLHVLMAANAEWVVPASHDERRFAVFDVSDRYAKNGLAENERKSYFDALHKEMQNGGAAAMLYDLLRWRLGDWHPRDIYETEGLRRQKEQSMTPLEQWFDELLQEGRLPGLRGVQSPKKFVQTQALVGDAEQRVPRLRGRLTGKQTGDFLRRHGCTAVRSNSARGWQFPPLAEMRAAWARRYGGRVWETPEQEDWQ